MSVVKWSDESKGVVDEKFRQEIEAELAMKRAMLGKDRDTEKEATREATRNVSKSKQRLMMKPKASAMPNDDDFRALSQPRCAQRDSFRVNKFMKEAAPPAFDDAGSLNPSKNDLRAIRSAYRPLERAAEAERERAEAEKKKPGMGKGKKKNPAPPMKALEA